MKLLTIMIAYILIYIATDIGRSKENQIKTFSKKWWVQIALIIVSAFIISNFHNWFD